MAKKHLGKIHLHTGDGHGKTTSALGMALRAIGHEYKVVVIQFMKGQDDIGEVNIAEKLKSNLKFYRFGTKDFVIKGKETKEDISEAQAGLSKAEEILKKVKPDMLILDELCMAIYFNLLDIDNVIKLLKKYRNKGTEIIITGRKADKKLIALADLVTEMKMVKHYYQSGIPAREGVEF